MRHPRRVVFQLCGPLTVARSTSRGVRKQCCSLPDNRLTPSESSHIFPLFTFGPGMDSFSREERSEIMQQVRSVRNASTEGVIVGALRSRHIGGWKLRPQGLPGSPDLFFPRSKLMVFLDGCFWHGCPRCFRAPSSRTEYWRPKIARNQSRDRRVSRLLRRQGYDVLRVWEHEIKSGKGFARLVRTLQIGEQ
jgi:DNA mismatch endonuclease (patch repair protein)